MQYHNEKETPQFKLLRFSCALVARDFCTAVGKLAHVRASCAPPPVAWKKRFRRAKATSVIYGPNGGGRQRR